MTELSMGEAGENPLVPNENCDRCTEDAEARRLDDTAAKRAATAGKRRISTIRGQEAVRVSTIIELGKHDLISDTEPTAGMGLLLGGDRASLLRGIASSKSKPEDLFNNAGCARHLGWVQEGDDRLQLALGAALALKTQGRGGIVVAYARKGELSAAAWKKILSSAAKLALPIIFVVLPRAGAIRKGAELNELCGVASAAGVPGIPVDACDSVALYRVTQESLGRTRGGDGPVLIESVRWRVDGKRTSIDDPLEHLKQFLLERRICDAKWFGQAAGKKNR